MSFRTIAAGAGMLAAFTFATSATTPAQSAGTTASPSSTQTRVAKPAHRTTRPQREASKARHSRRARLAARHRHRSPLAQADIDSIPRPTARAESASVARQETASARRFREFLTPESFAGVANEDLRSPRMAAAHFSGQIADPELELANPTEPAAAPPPTGAPPIVAHDQAAGEDTANKAPAVAQSDSIQVLRATPREKQSDGMSFLRWFFIAWGGVLTFASAVRMAV